MVGFPPILLAEDEEHDVFFIRRAFAKTGVANPIYAVPDGAQAMEYLSGQGQYGNRAEFPRPCLLITDLKMPRMDGFELLAWIRQQGQLKELPCVVMSSSAHEADAKRALELGAQGFFTKPSDTPGLIELVKHWHRSFIIPHCGATTP